MARYRHGLFAILCLMCMNISTSVSAAKPRTTTTQAANVTTTQAANVTTTTAMPKPKNGTDLENATLPIRAQTYNITMKTLLLSTDTAMSTFPKTVMTAYGHSFTNIELYVNGSTTDPDASFLNDLVDSQGNPQYNSIVTVSSTLGIPQKNGTWTSALNKTHWKILHDYMAKYNVRLVSLASSYAVDPGMVAAPGFEKGMTGDAIVSFNDTKFTDSILGNAKKTAKFRVGQVNEFVYTSYWWTPAFVKSNQTHINTFLLINPPSPILNPACNKTLNPTTTSANATNSSTVTPSNNVNCSSNQTENMVSEPNWVGGFVREVDGREEMHFLINANQFGHHGFVLADIWLTWAVQNIWIGQRRMLLDTQIDDILMSTRLYNVKTDSAATEDDPAYRATADDYRQLHEYAVDLNKRLGKGNRYVPQMAYNGIGWFFNEYDIDSVNKKINEVRDNFFWVSHTWSHLDMYCPNSNCAKFGNTKYNETLWDLQKNVWFTEEVLYGNVPAQHLETWPTYSPNSLVTPRISGLNWTDSIQAMLDTNINNAVGDNSRKDLKPPNPYHAFPSPALSHDNRSALVIPRQATRVYFDVSTPAENSKEHASIYGPKCFGYNRTEAVTFPWKCNRDSFKYPRQLAFEDIMMIEGFEVARNLLAWRHDPYMFHQANIRFSPYQGRNVSLLTMWVDATLSYVSNYTSAPIYTVKMDELKTIYEERMERDNCGLVGHLEYKKGKPRNVYITGERNCTAKISRVVGPDGSDPLRLRMGGTEEKYGVDRTRDVRIKQGTTRRIYITRSKTYEAKYAPPLSYPLISSTVRQLLALKKVKNAKQFEIFILESMIAAEKDLQKKLADDLVPLVERHKALGALVCRNGKGGDAETKKELIALDREYYNLSLPAKTARTLNVPVNSWYLLMEESVTDTVKKLKVHAKKTIPKHIKKARRSISQHSIKSVDRLEEYATLYFGRRYKAFIDLKKRFNGLPNCKDGKVDPVPEANLTTFAAVNILA